LESWEKLIELVLRLVFIATIEATPEKNICLCDRVGTTQEMTKKRMLSSTERGKEVIRSQKSRDLKPWMHMACCSPESYPSSSIKTTPTTAGILCSPAHPAIRRLLCRAHPSSLCRSDVPRCYSARGHPSDRESARFVPASQVVRSESGKAIPLSSPSL
jgi:hypothetical protein